MNSRSTSSPPPANDSEYRRLSAWVCLAALASFATLAAPFFLGRVYVADDLGEFHLPLRNFYAEQLSRGQPFDWMSSVFGGFYVAGEGQLGAYHPLHLILYCWLPLGAAFDLELLLSYPFMFAGTYLWLRQLLSHQTAAYFGALTFTFCGFSLLHFVHPNAVAVAAHIPWLLLAIDVALGSRSTGNQPASGDGIEQTSGQPMRGIASELCRYQRAWAELGIALLTASQLLLGYPQYVWFSLILEIAYIAWRSTIVRPGLSTLSGIVLAKFLGVLVGAVQLLPTLDALADSVRRVPDAAFSMTGSLHPLNLVQLLAPYLFRTRVVGQNTHELGIYAGAVPIVLCIWLLAHHRNWGRFRPLVVASLAFGAFGLVLAAGEFGGLARLQSWVPLVNRFRFPCRASLLAQLCLAVAAAVALALLLEQAGTASRDQRRHRPLIVAWLASLGLALIGPLLWPAYTADSWLVWCGPLLIGIAVGLVAAVERGVRGASIALVLFTAVDLSSYGLSYSVYRRTADLHEFVAAAPVPPDGSHHRVAAQRATNGLRTGDRMLLAGVQRVDGYAGLEPAKRLDYSTPEALQLAGVEWVFHPAPGTPSETAQQWTALAPTAPRARLTPWTDSDPSIREASTVVASTLTADTSPAELAGANAVPRSADGDDSTRILVDEPGNIVVETDGPRQRLLVTTESFHKGWLAFVDERVATVIRVDGDFLGCVVDAGAHRVRFQFWPQSRQTSLMLSAGGVVLMVCAFWLRSRSATGTPPAVPTEGSP